MLLGTSPILTRYPRFISTSFICPVIHSMNSNRGETTALYECPLHKDVGIDLQSVVQPDRERQRIVGSLEAKPKETQ